MPTHAISLWSRSVPVSRFNRFNWSPPTQQVQNGQTAFSFGCDRGDDPSRRDTRITGINKYNQHLGVSNLEIAGAPIDGRSGGGLFDESGRLIGVCNAADYKGDVGIYAGPGSISLATRSRGSVSAVLVGAGRRARFHPAQRSNRQPARARVFPRPRFNLPQWQCPPQNPRPRPPPCRRIKKSS